MTAPYSTRKSCHGARPPQRRRKNSKHDKGHRSSHHHRPARTHRRMIVRPQRHVFMLHETAPCGGEHVSCTVSGRCNHQLPARFCSRSPVHFCWIQASRRRPRHAIWRHRALCARRTCHAARSRWACGSSVSSVGGASSHRLPAAFAAAALWVFTCPRTNTDTGHVNTHRHISYLALSPSLPLSGLSPSPPSLHSFSTLSPLCLIRQHSSAAARQHRRLVIQHHRFEVLVEVLPVADAFLTKRVRARHLWP